MFGWSWLRAKIILVLIMSGVHGFFVRCVREFAADQNQRPPEILQDISMNYQRSLMIGIVLLAVVKPF